MKEARRIGFIGTGVMGVSMAGHLIRAGHQLHVFNRTREKANPLIQMGAKWEPSPARVAQATEVMITIVGYPHDVEALYLGEDGLVSNARPGTVLIDMTTSSPELAERIAVAAQERGLTALDAPVSGGDVGARAGHLTIMAGGDAKAFETVLPLLQLMGQNIRRQGGPGAGQHTKMCNQIAIAAGMVGVCEAMAYARKSGLDPESVLASITGGAAASWSLSNLAPRMLRGDEAPGFYVKHFIKDIQIALESAATLGLDLPGLALAKRLYDSLSRQGGESLGTQALFRLYQDDSRGGDFSPLIGGR